MYIKYKSQVEITYLDFSKVYSFQVLSENYIRFYFSHSEFEDFIFKTKKKRDKAVKEIENGILEKKIFCDLG